LTDDERELLIEVARGLVAHLDDVEGLRDRMTHWQRADRLQMLLRNLGDTSDEKRERAWRERFEHAHD
jgi:hypothetical protein